MGAAPACMANAAAERKRQAWPVRPSSPGSDDRTDAVDLEQPAVALINGRCDLLGQRSQPGVAVSDLGDQIAGELLADDLHRAGRPDAKQHATGGGNSQIDLGATGHEITKQGVELVDQSGAVADHVAAALVEHGRDGRSVLSGDRQPITDQCCDTGRSSRVDCVIVASAAA